MVLLTDRSRRYTKAFLLGFCGVLTGAFLTLVVPSVRYTPHFPPRVYDEAPSVLFERMKQNRDAFLFIDVRPPADYEKLHAEGAMNIPIHLFYDKRKEFPRDGKTIVLICTGGRLSGVAYSYLEHYGFRNIVRVGGGIEAWQNEKLPVVLGDVLQ